MRTGSEGLSTRERVKPKAMGRRVAVFSDASTDIFLRKAEDDTMMSAMINPPESSTPRHRRFSPANLPAKVASADAGVFSI
jgi:hypothetical protein